MVAFDAQDEVSEEPDAEARPMVDPSRLARASSSLGSFCRRWAIRVESIDYGVEIGHRIEHG